jgi:hypothetical protein
MAPVRIRPEAELRASVAVALGDHGARIAARLPGVEIEHVGSTSIPGALTKGDLDLLVRVDAAGFDAAVVTLRGLYAVHQPENWTPTYASFLDPAAVDPPVGVQLAIRGSADDLLFAPFRQALIDDPAAARVQRPEAVARRRGLRALHGRQGRLRRPGAGARASHVPGAVGLATSWRAKCCGCTEAFQASRAGSIPVARSVRRNHGEWRSLVAHPAGGRAVAGSNPVSPMKWKPRVCGAFVLLGAESLDAAGIRRGTNSLRTGWTLRIAGVSASSRTGATSPATGSREFALGDPAHATQRRGQGSSRHPRRRCRRPAPWSTVRPVCLGPGARSSHRGGTGRAGMPATGGTRRQAPDGPASARRVPLRR